MLVEDIKAFAKLGNLLGYLGNCQPWPGFECGLSEDEYNSFEEVIVRTKVHNPWFTEANVRKSLVSFSFMLQEAELQNWLDDYNFKEEGQKDTVAIIMAGNIPMVGFHDLLCTLLSGSKALVKLSSDDRILLPKILEFLFHFNPDLSSRILITDSKLENFDRVIATGSNNTSRYFDHYFGKYPNIIRRNRSSVAILTGDENPEELNMLGEDIFSYFGLGCRNVSKVFIPHGYDLDVFFKSIVDYSEVINHNKYANNYDYNKAIWLLNNDKILDNGFLLLKESESISAPTATLFYEYYNSLDELREKLDDQQDEIQCVVSKHDIPFGQAQNPGLSDYADNIDTLEFLLKG